jgi:beta-lactamase regulating signal transducer with metallopeptidase domain
MLAPRRREKAPHKGEHVSKAPSTSNGEQAVINTRARKARVEAASSSSRIGRAYERFLKLPVLAVLLVLWVAGVAMLGSVVLVAYAIIAALMRSW